MTAQDWIELNVIISVALCFLLLVLMWFHRKFTLETYRHVSNMVEDVRLMTSNLKALVDWCAAHQTYSDVWKATFDKQIELLLRRTREMNAEISIMKEKKR